MNISSLTSGSPLSKNYHLNQNAMPTAEDVAAFEASLGEASEAASDNNHDASRENSDSSTPAESWDVVWKNFDQAVFDSTRRDLARWDQMKKDIDYGNKT